MDRLLQGTVVVTASREDETAALKQEILSLRAQIKRNERAAAEATSLAHRHAELQKAHFILQKDLEQLRRRHMIECNHVVERSPRLTALTIQAAGGSLALGETLEGAPHVARRLPR